MNPSYKEDEILTTLRRAQTGCRRGLITPDELIVFIKLIIKITSIIQARRAYYEEHKSIYRENIAEGLNIISATLEANTKEGTYLLINPNSNIKNTGYIGPRTSIYYDIRDGYLVTRDEGRSSWDEWIDSEDGHCSLTIEDKNGREVGYIIEEIKEMLLWRSMRINVKDNQVININIAIDRKQLRRYADNSN